MQIVTMATKHIYGHDWKEETSHAWTFQPMTKYNRLQDNSSSTLPFSEIGPKATENWHLYPSHVRMSSFRRSLHCLCPVNRGLVKTVGESEMQINKLRKFCVCIHFNASATLAGRNGKKQDFSTKALLPCSQKKVNDRYCRKSI